MAGPPTVARTAEQVLRHPAFMHSAIAIDVGWLRFILLRTLRFAIQFPSPPQVICATPACRCRRAAHLPRLSSRSTAPAVHSPGAVSFPPSGGNSWEAGAAADAPG